MGATASGLTRARREQLVAQSEVYSEWLIDGSHRRQEYKRPLQDGTTMSLWRVIQQPPNGLRVLAARQRLAFASGVFHARLAGDDSCLWWFATDACDDMFTDNAELIGDVFRSYVWNISIAITASTPGGRLDMGVTRTTLSSGDPEAAAVLTRTVSRQEALARLKPLLLLMTDSDFDELELHRSRNSSGSDWTVLKRFVSHHYHGSVGVSDEDMAALRSFNRTPSDWRLWPAVGNENIEFNTFRCAMQSTRLPDLDDDNRWQLCLACAVCCCCCCTRRDLAKVYRGNQQLVDELCHPATSREP